MDAPEWNHGVPMGGSAIKFLTEDKSLKAKHQFLSSRAKELLEWRNAVGRTCFESLKGSVTDASRQSVAQLLRENWDGCRELWKQDYRCRKALRSSSIQLHLSMHRLLLLSDWIWSPRTPCLAEVHCFAENSPLKAR